MREPGYDDVPRTILSHPIITIFKKVAANQDRVCCETNGHSTAADKPPHGFIGRKTAMKLWGDLALHRPGRDNDIAARHSPHGP